MLPQKLLCLIEFVTAKVPKCSGNKIFLWNYIDSNEKPNENVSSLIGN